MGMVAAGGSLGILIPPSIMLVMMADQAGDLRRQAPHVPA